MDLVAATEEEYDKLFKEPNWRDYWRPRYDAYLMGVDALLAELLHDESQEGQIKPVTKDSSLNGITQEIAMGWLDDLEKNEDADK